MLSITEIQATITEITEVTKDANIVVWNILLWELFMELQCPCQEKLTLYFSYYFIKPQ